MNSPHENGWLPTPELLAAFADRELEDRPECAEVRRRIEEWLVVHPEGRAQLEAQEELSRLMASTKPQEPKPAAWAKAWLLIDNNPMARTKGRPAARWVAAALTVGTAAAVVFWALQGGTDLPSGQGVQHALRSRSALKSDAKMVRFDPPRAATPAEAAPPATSPVRVGDGHAQDMAVLPVATADEVEIIHVVGGDPRMVVVGRPPWSGPVILLNANEVEVQPPFNTMTRMGSGSTPILMMPQSNK